MDEREFTIPLREGRFLAIPRPAGVMAILNVTPDSFSDGGWLVDAAHAVEAGKRFADAGAALLDIGGESTRPRGSSYGQGATEVPDDVDIARVIPVIHALRKERPRVPISVDTRKGAVARAALEAGADVVNVITGLDAADDLLAAVAVSGAALVLSHCRGTPETTFEVSRFTDVVKEVARDLSRARERALAAGIAPQKLLLDPGFGFGKTGSENDALLDGLDRLAPPGQPLVVGASRKAFLVLGREPIPEPRERLPESLAACARALGAARGRPLLLRVHDVAETVRFLEVLGR
jgi:dihydropteroate synthase